MRQRARTITTTQSTVWGAAMGTLAGLIAKDLWLHSIFSFGIDPTLIVLACGAACALLVKTPLRRVIPVLTLALFLLWMIVAFTPLTSWLFRGLDRRDPLTTRADAVVVLGSRLQTDGEPTTAAMHRLLHSLELLGEGRAPRLIVTELYPPSARYRPVAEKWMRALKLEQELFDVGPIQNTHDEALAVAALCQTKGWRRIVLVTSPAHSARASATFEKQGLEVVASPSIETEYDVEVLDRRYERLHAFAPLLHERLGLIAYRQRGWIH